MKPTRAQKIEWNQRLKECGFDDAESLNGRLKREKFARSKEWATERTVEIARTWAETADRVAQSADMKDRGPWVMFSLGFSIRQVCTFFGLTFGHARVSYTRFQAAVKKAALVETA